MPRLKITTIVEESDQLVIHGALIARARDLERMAIARIDVGDFDQYQLFLAEARVLRVHAMAIAAARPGDNAQPSDNKGPTS